MSKTIKVIDLLNKIANGEYVPKRIKYNYETFKWDNIEKKYYKDRKGEDYIFISFDTYALNDTVEIIEEEPEIDIQGIEAFKTNYAGDFVEKELAVYFNNKILPAIKQLDNQINNK